MSNSRMIVRELQHKQNSISIDLVAGAYRAARDFPRIKSHILVLASAALEGNSGTVFCAGKPILKHNRPSFCRRPIVLL